MSVLRQWVSFTFWPLAFRGCGLISTACAPPRTSTAFRPPPPRPGRHLSPPRPQPLKHKRYPCGSPKEKRMTVCIAAMCQKDGEPRIVVCADTRLDQGYLGTNDHNVKIQPLGHGWFTLLAADDWPAAVSMFEHMRSRGSQDRHRKRRTRCTVH